MSSRKRKISPDPPSSSKTTKISAAVTTEVAIIEKRRDSWKLSDKDANSAMALMEADGLTDEEMQDDLRVFLYAKGMMKDKSKAVRKEEFDNLLNQMKDGLRVFLYAKGIMRDEESDVRKKRFNSLLNPDGAKVSDEARKKLKLARERLRRIVVKGEVGKNFDDEPSLFDLFVAKHPEWGPEKSYVVFRDHDLLKDKPHAYVERVQLSGLCYMHAPVILQHYLVAMHSHDAVPMLDMAVYLKKHMSAEALERHIWLNKGGDSKAFIEKILVQDPAPVFDSVSAEHDLESSLRQYGPGLVSGFKVETDFNSSTWQHIGKKKMVSTGLHAMVLVGFRKQGNGIRYLLQNWWKKKPFIEVDADYLESCGAIAHFVKTAQDRMGEFQTNSHDHVECEMLDAEETFDPEMLH